ncbi:unnamed protein product [Notodromas monacha]|uniref:NUC153 domain-containing protein n=1 Tax=Notodromas monacha TaxID=399045 RepID=A0A7R9BM66_9CRUS|nr:unnamed protein product [Notodromas monacha]CAG0918074.1 unnamed protein product [Notodromas monacha]
MSESGSKKKDKASKNENSAMNDENAGSGRTSASKGFRSKKTEDNSEKRKKFYENIRKKHKAVSAQDDRFKSIRNDPRFRPMRLDERKVIVDDRFKAMLTDPKFNLTHKVDSRGRPAKIKSSAENMRKYYAFENEEAKEKVESVGEDETDEDDSDASEGEKPDETIPDYARGELALQSSSEDESSSDEESSASEAEDVEHPWGELDADAPRAPDTDSSRLAICNMDWDRVSAKDIYVALSSFLRPDSQILSVKIYKSEFGKERMAIEQVSGPVELKPKTNLKSKAVKEHKKPPEEEDESDEETRERVRQYQLNRLKYFYAVATFDSSETANKVYDECDGVEYESSATKFDLRFVPDSETFEEIDVVDQTSSVDLQSYVPHLFVNTALQQGKVKCTWDENDPRREKAIDELFKVVNPKSKKDKKALKKKGKLVDGLNEEDWQAYLASDSDPEENDYEAGLGKDGKLSTYRELVNSIKSKEKEDEEEKAHMEISWNPVDVEPVKELLNKKKEEEKTETPWDRYLLKLKEKKKSKRRKNPEDDEEASELTKEDLNDPFFASSNLDDEYDPIREFKKGSSKKNDEPQIKQNEEENKDDGLELLTLDMDPDAKKHFSLKKLVKLEKLKGKKKLHKNDKKKLQALDVGDDFAVDVTDPRFNAVYTNQAFSVDPSDPHFKPTTGMKAIVAEKTKRRKNTSTDVEELPNLTPKSELSSLVQNVKRKMSGNAAWKNKRARN